MAFLPELQRGLPVPAEYRREEPGVDSELNAYDAVYYAGDSNAGAKTIALDRVGAAGIPVDIVFRQGFDVLGL